MIIKIMIFKLFASALIALQISAPSPMVQIFDVKQEKVVRQSPLPPSLKRAVMELLDESPTVYNGIDMNPKSGVVLHIEFGSPVQLSSSVYPGAVQELYLFLEHGEKPKSLIFVSGTSKFKIVVLDGDSDAFIQSHRLTPSKTPDS